MNIKIFNTLHGKVEAFNPLEAGKVSMYTCGPTVYDYAHIGNFRAFVFEDLLRRFLEYKGYKVRHVMNITDVDDKTIAGANQNVGAIHEPASPAGGAPLQRLQNFTARYARAFNEDLKTLNILPPTEQPLATENMESIKDLIGKLIAKKMAYEKDGSVYYRVASFKNYGKLSKKKLECNISGASERVSSDEYESKEEAADFALWKKAKEGEPSWDSPWGKGRPGWHIECSAMSMKCLGETFDIHAGGEDLVFPHHENEIAQSEGATGKQFVRYWMHCKFLLVNGEKMSKSKGNFYTLRDLIAKEYDPMAVRYALLSTHYRTPLNFTLEGLKEAGEVIKRLDDCYATCLNWTNNTRVTMGLINLSQDDETDLEGFLNRNMRNIDYALSDDLNISMAFSSVASAITEINKAIAKGAAGKKNMESAIDYFQKLDLLFGFDIAGVTTIPEDLIVKVRKLVEARTKRDFKTSDAIRDEIKQTQWIVKDGKPGEPSTLRLKRRVWDK